MASINSLFLLYAHHVLSSSHQQLEPCLPTEIWAEPLTALTNQMWMKWHSETSKLRHERGLKISTFSFLEFWVSTKGVQAPIGVRVYLEEYKALYILLHTTIRCCCTRVILLSYYGITDHSRTFGVAQNSNIYLFIHLQLVQSLALLPDAVHRATSSKLDWGLKDSHTSLLSCTARTETSYNLGFFRLGSKCECPKRNLPKRVSQWKPYYLSWASLEVT